MIQETIRKEMLAIKSLIPPWKQFNEIQMDQHTAAVMMELNLTPETFKSPPGRAVQRALFRRLF